jgi:hypothetical protein
MNLLEKLIEFLNYEMSDKPVMYGWFHLLFLTLLVLVSMFIILRYHNSDNRKSRRLLLILSSIMIVFEIYKQLVYSYQNGVWDYQWYAFPFQFSSVPMYIAFVAAIIKEGKVQNALYAFLGTFGLFGGLAVMLYPTDVFINMLGISIQTMVHHGLQVIIGLHLLTSGKVRLSKKSIIPAALVFFGMVLIAFMMNIATHNLGETFNMFFVDWQEGCHIVILTTIQAQYGYFVFIIAYLFGFVLAAFLVLLISIGIKRLVSKKEYIKLN